MTVSTKDRFVIEEVLDPELNARCREQDARAKRNSDWLEAHWVDLLPKVRGRFIAVAGEQAFIGDSPAEAHERARQAHPDDDGVLVQYVQPLKGPRIYGHRG